MTRTGMRVALLAGAAVLCLFVVGAVNAQPSARVITVTTATRPHADVMNVRFSDHVRRPALRYVRRAYRGQSDLPLPVAGRHILMVSFQDTGFPLGRRITRVLTPRRAVIRQVKLADDWEGVTSYAVGLGRRVKPRVVLTGRTAVVVFPR